MQKTTTAESIIRRRRVNIFKQRESGKYWRFRYYRPSDNKRDKMRLGVYPEISLKEAREKREELRMLIAKGIDPKLHQQDKAQRQTEQLKKHLRLSRANGIATK